MLASGGSGRGCGELAGIADLAPGQPQTLERLGRGHLVDEVQVDEKQVRLAFRGTDHMGVPQLLGEGLGLVWHRERQLYAPPGPEICALGTIRTGVWLVNINNLMAQPSRLFVLLLGLLGLIGIQTGARAN